MYHYRNCQKYSLYCSLMCDSVTNSVTICEKFLSWLAIINLKIFSNELKCNLAGIYNLPEFEVSCYNPVPFVLLQGQRNVIRKCLVSLQRTGMPARPIWWQRQDLSSVGSWQVGSWYSTTRRVLHCSNLVQLASGVSWQQKTKTIILFCHHLLSLLPGHHQPARTDQSKYSNNEIVSLIILSGQFCVVYEWDYLVKIHR